MDLTLKTLHSALLCFVLLLITLSGYAQNLETIGKDKPFRVSGGVSLTQILYGAKGIPDRRSPYSYYGSGSLNFGLYGWNVPVTFSLSNHNVSYQQPFNQYSLHPTYKWVRAHLGYTSTSFSPYTMSGHMFLGGGVELTPPGKFKVSALYGRFLKAVQPDSTNTSITPAFKRMGFGMKASYGDNNDYVNLIVFHAQDQINSIAYVPEKQGILPQENLVMSIGGGKTFFQKLALKAEWATSAMTRDIRAEKATQQNLLAKMGFLYTPRISSSYYNAWKSSLTYQFSRYAVGFGYERIDPQYQTLGAYYFNNDLENITANAATSLLNGKANLAVSIGTQRDNLDKSKISTMHRTVGSANLAYAPSQKVNLTLSYSSFQTFTNIRSQFVNINQLTPYDNLDTLKYTQISQNASANVLYMFGTNKQKRQTINMNLMVQDAADKQGGVPQNSGLRFYNSNVAYSLGLLPQNLTLSVSFNATISKGAGTDTKTLGPTLALSRSFFDKKFRVTASASSNNSYSNGTLLSNVVNGRISGSLSIHKKHNINLSTVVVNRANKVEGGAQSFTEFTGTLGYAYSFGR